MKNYKHFTFTLFSMAILASCGNETDAPRQTSTSSALVQYQSCNELEADLKEMYIAELNAQFDQYENGGYFGGGDTGGVPEVNQADDAAGDSGTRTEGEDFSGTNNQEDGVDEADFTKTDGFHIYTLNGNRLHIFGTPEFGDLLPESEFEIEGYPSEMLIDKDSSRVVVFSKIYPWSLPDAHPLRELIGGNSNQGWYWHAQSVSKATVIDVSDPTSPQLVRELFVEGRYQTARKVDSSVRLGLYSSVTAPGLVDYWSYFNDDYSNIEEARRAATAQLRANSLSDMLPKLYERQPDGSFNEETIVGNTCDNFYIPSNGHSRGLTSLFSFDLSAEELEIDSDHVISNQATLYASQDYLYLAEQANSWWWQWQNEDYQETLNVHMFDIRDAGESKYLGSGHVDGALLNQFSMSEHDGYLRLAATTDRFARWWVEPNESEIVEPENHLYVLGLDNDELEQVGHVGGIARGEQIFSARMVGDKGYIVTFENVDPLFTLDLSNPRDPKVIGELKIPGFSTYIHPIANDKLLTIGVGGDDEGANWKTQISMFDVSDFSEPAVSDIEELITDGDWGWSEAQYNHKAFQYWEPKGLLAVPLSGVIENPNGGVNDEEYYYNYFSRLELIEVDPDLGALASYGSIDHSSFFESDQYYDYRDVRRSIFMGDYIYAISSKGITVHTAEGLTPVTAQTLPGDLQDFYWWW